MTSKQAKINLYGDIKFQVKTILKSLPDDVKLGLEEKLQAVLKHVENSVEALQVKAVNSKTFDFPFNEDSIIETITEHSGYSGWESCMFEATEDDIYVHKEEIKENGFPLPEEGNVYNVFEIMRSSKGKHELFAIKLIVGGGYVTGMYGSSSATLGFPVSSYDNFIETLKTVD